MYTKLILGPPGTGKTTTLLNIVEDKLKNIIPEKIAFFSFTNKAIDEAIFRASSRFNYEEKRLKYFRTLHSLAFRETGLNANRIFNYKHFKPLERLTGFRLLGKNPEEEVLTEKGDKFLFIYGKSKNVKLTLKDLWLKEGTDIDYRELEYFVNTFEAYKKENNLVYWPDMLENYIKFGESLNIDIAIIDEAQDLTPLQWDVVKLAVPKAKELYIAGDDDQAIYRWSGADVEQFLNLKISEKTILPKSYRLTKNICSFSKKITKKITKRYDKQWESRPEIGVIQYHNDPEKIDFSEGEWLILGRSNYQLRSFEEILRSRGLLYKFKNKKSVDDLHIEMIKGYVQLQKGIKIKESTFSLFKNLYDEKVQWYDALQNISLYNREYYRSLLRNGEKLSEEPKIHIGTIHGSKGGECQKVLIITDLAKQVYDTYMQDPDDEHRVFYVACTRAKEELHVLMPQTEMSYCF